MLGYRAEENRRCAEPAAAIPSTAVHLCVVYQMYAHQNPYTKILYMVSFKVAVSN
jgi:hypothetical protein